jgi:hypothetical protein
MTTFINLICLDFTRSLHTGGSNSTEQERSVDALYIGRADNGSGHVVFKLNTKQPVSVNRVNPIPTTDAIIDTVTFPRGA